MYQQTTAYQKLLKLNKRIRGVAGGSSASKTISILQWLIDACQNYQGNLTCSVVSESMPHLKRGAIRDFINIIKEHEYFNDSRWNKTDYIYDFSDKKYKKILEFFSADQPGKTRGPRRDILFINEANNVPYETFTQLEIRTNKIIWLDWNPVNDFWWYSGDGGDKAVKERDDSDFLILTYKDNEAIPTSIKQSIESHINNKNWWQVYGLGLLGDVEGKIYRNWNIIDELPHEARLYRKGLDFGYTNDPTAIIAAYKFNDGYILDEEVFQRGMTNNIIADTLKNLLPCLVKADSAEPKSIEEIRQYGINIVPVIKGKDSINQGIQYVQNQRISVTKRSVNLLEEYRKYFWQTDANGKIINEPIEGWNHCMDAIRYLFDDSVQHVKQVQQYNKSKWAI